MEVREHPIIFNTQMVRAILNGSKTQSRRVIKPQPTEAGLQFATACGGEFYAWQDDGLNLDEYSEDGGGCHRLCPYGQVGDQLWVRESLLYSPVGIPIRYKADSCPVFRDGEAGYAWEWKKNTLNAIFMPRWASRITLEITEVRVSKLKDMTESDAHLEGVDNLVTFMLLWDRLNKKRGYEWISNCWVWVITFKLCQ